MKTWTWWFGILVPGLIAAFVLLVNADVIDPDAEYVPSGEDCYWEYDEETGEEYEVCATAGTDEIPGGNPFFEYIERIPIPNHPAVAWTAFGVVMAAALTRGTVIPMIAAIDKARDNSRFNKE